MKGEDSFSDQRDAAQALGDVLADLERRSAAFGAALTGALKGAAREGRGLEDVLRSAGLRISEIALSAGLKPLEGLIGQALSSALTSVGEGLGGAAADGGGAAPFVAGGLAAPRGLARALAAQTSESGPDGEATRGSGAGAAGRTGAQATAGPTIQFYVTTPDAESFRKSEGQIAAMLTRTVGRGRRGV